MPRWRCHSLADRSWTSASVRPDERQRADLNALRYILPLRARSMCQGNRIPDQLNGFKFRAGILSANVAWISGSVVQCAPGRMWCAVW